MSYWGRCIILVSEPSIIDDQFVDYINKGLLNILRNLKVNNPCSLEFLNKSLLWFNFEATDKWFVLEVMSILWRFLNLLPNYIIIHWRNHLKAFVSILLFQRSISILEEVKMSSEVGYPGILIIYFFLSFFAVFFLNDRVEFD